MKKDLMVPFTLDKMHGFYENKKIVTYGHDSAFICADGLDEYFKIPPTTKKIYVRLSKQKSKEAYRVTFTNWDDTYLELKNGEKNLSLFPLQQKIKCVSLGFHYT